MRIVHTGDWVRDTAQGIDDRNYVTGVFITEAGTIIIELDDGTSLVRADGETVEVRS